MPAMLLDQPDGGSHRDRWLDVRVGAPGAERQAKLAGASSQHLDSKVSALDPTAMGWTDRSLFNLVIM